MNWYIKVLKNYVTFSGRASRREYWMFVLINFLVSFAFAIISRLTGAGVLISTIYHLAVFLPAIAVGIRRIHDSDHSGWWLLVPIGNLYFLIVNGTCGVNKYGSDPKD
jgi:uncharacterized membrane protein YhaH (DUF805 family)